MKIYYCSCFQGTTAWLGLPAGTVKMDCEVVDTQGLLAALELRLGLYTPNESSLDRLVAYYKSLRTYMQQGCNYPSLAQSYAVAPLAVARELLTWRDALALCGWTEATPAPSPRLQVLQGVERSFRQQGCHEPLSRISAVISAMQQHPEAVADLTVVLPTPLEWEHPACQRLLRQAMAVGVKVEQLHLPQRQKTDNLARVSQLLADNSLQQITLDPHDASLRILCFSDEQEAAEYLASRQQPPYDVVVQPNGKVMDNYLSMMGRPVSGSRVDNSSPQIVQLFFLGVALLQRPLNIHALLAWLYVPIHPLPARLRRQLAYRLARNGGWYGTAIDDDERAVTCCQVLNQWLDGSDRPADAEPLSPRERRQRQAKADVFLPDFQPFTARLVSIDRLRALLSGLVRWARISRMELTGIEKEKLDGQYAKLIELCQALTRLTDDVNDHDTIAYDTVAQHLTTLNVTASFVQYAPQVGSSFSVQTPAQLLAPAERVLWWGMQNYVPEPLPTAFLTPSEQSALAPELTLWTADQLRQQQNSLLLQPFRCCTGQITLVAFDNVDGEVATKHPLLVRLQNQITNYSDFESRPIIGEGLAQTVPCLSLPDEKDTVQLHNASLISWRDHESHTSIDALLQNPVDYVLQYVARISDNGQQELSDLKRTKGNVAHAVIQRLFLQKDVQDSGLPDQICRRFDTAYDEVFGQVVEENGAILLLPENQLDCRQLRQQLRDCIQTLLQIITVNDLQVKGCELPLNGHPLGAEDSRFPSVMGFADMVLSDKTGKTYVFDFKWSASRSWHEKLLKENRSTQLALYAALLKEQEQRKRVATAYFVMPWARLFTYDKHLSGDGVIHVEEPQDLSLLLPRIRESYLYRRSQIDQGQVETAEQQPLDTIAYEKDTEKKNLFPLEADYNKKDIKASNAFSLYKQLKQ